MITSRDKEYQATKLIKQGLARIASPLDELAAWVNDTWSVTVLNVIYDPRNDLHAPRIQVILEHENDAQSFRDGYNYDQAKQDAIASQFRNIIDLQLPDRYDLEGLFVVFSPFAPIAREEADARISEKDIDALKRRIGNPDLWEVSRNFGHVTFMFYTDAQVHEYAAKGMREEYTKKYFELLKPHDEFGYFSGNDFSIHFDSKQNFDDNYQSSWYYYYN